MGVIVACVHAQSQVSSIDDAEVENDQVSQSDNREQRIRESICD